MHVKGFELLEKWRGEKAAWCRGWSLRPYPLSTGFTLVIELYEGEEHIMHAVRFAEISSSTDVDVVLETVLRCIQLLERRIEGREVDLSRKGREAVG